MKKMYHGKRNHYFADTETARTCEEFAEVASACYAQPWDSETFMEYLRDGFTFTAMNGVLTGSEEEKVIGFAVFRRSFAGIRLLCFGVHPTFQNHGLGRQMLQSFVRKAESEQLDIHTVALESDAAALKILLSLGFKVVRTERGTRDKVAMDCYHLRYSCRNQVN